MLRCLSILNLAKMNLSTGLGLFSRGLKRWMPKIFSASF
jgi:hypothetical protein